MTVDYKQHSHLEDAAGNEIVDMNSSFESRLYNTTEFVTLMIGLKWDNPAVVGVLELIYCTGNICETYSTTSVTGAFDTHAWLDSNMPASSIKIKFTHTSGTANLVSSISFKGDK